MISARAPARGTKARGSVLLEGALAIFPLALALALNLELMVRARRHAVLAWVTCDFVRSRALGNSWRGSEAKSESRVKQALRAVEGLWWEEERTSAGLSLRGHWIYPALWRQSGLGVSKHHFEVNELCRYPF